MLHQTALGREGRIGPITVKNRIVMPAMATGLGSINGEVTRPMIDYYRERAAGGAGMIIVEITCVDSPQGRGTFTQIRADHPRYIFGLNQLSEAIQAYGCKAMLQLHHAGRQTNALATDGLQPVAPSPIACKLMRAEPRELTLEEIGAVRQKFISAAYFASQAGFDGVELHAAHGYLLSQFLSPYTNHRQDQYGGSTENRARLLVEIITAIKSKLPQLALSVRVNLKDFVKGGLEPAEGLEIAAMIEAAGADLLNVSSGIYESGQTSIEPAVFDEGWRTELPAAVKAKVKIPVLGGGVIRHPQVAEKLIESGQMDFVWIGRGMIADPRWAHKALSGNGKHIRPCLSCNTCIDSSFKGLPIHCTVNPYAGREWRNEPTGDLTGRKAVVAGGGPAGMQAALNLAQAGAAVELLEQGDRLGGLLNIASLPPHKQRLAELVQYLQTAVEHSNVTVHLQTPLSLELLAQYKPDLLVLAIGARPVVPDVFKDAARVFTLEEILSGGKISGENIAVIGGGSSGCELAEYLADAGNTVTIIEQAPQLATGLEAMTRLALLAGIRAKGVKMMTAAAVTGIQDGVVTVARKDGETEQLPCDRIALACGYAPERQLFEAVKEQAGNVYVIGDAVTARGVQEAMTEAATVAARYIKYMESVERVI